MSAARWLIGMFLAFTANAYASGAAQITSVRVWAAPDHTRIVFDLSAPVAHELISLESPNRLVVDFKNSVIAGSVEHLNSHKGSVNHIRSAVRDGKDVRVVLDLNQVVKPRSFLLKPNHQYGHRLVIDLLEANSQAANQPVKNTEPGNRDIVVVIDAGHGGDDGGARGKNGTQEKDVALDIAKRLARLVNAEPGMRGELTRNGDYFLTLKQRTKIARAKKADLFVSIHADAYHNADVTGSSVFVLSQKGASSAAAKFLADQENDADVIGGVSLDDKDDLLASILVDLSRDKTIEYSTRFGDRVLSELKQIGEVHHQQVQSAGFVVLKSLDVPSILVETAFISNPQEEQKLRSSVFQQTMAQSILSGIQRYFPGHQPSATRMAALAKKHKIEVGDTLSGIAKQYAVKLSRLLAVNNLSNANDIRVGQVLDIPGAS